MVQSDEPSCRNMDTKRLRTNLTVNSKLRNSQLERRENVGRNIASRCAVLLNSTQLLRPILTSTNLLDKRENVGRDITSRCALLLNSTRLLRPSPTSENLLNKQLLQQTSWKHSVTTENKHLDGPAVKRMRLQNLLLDSRTLATKLELKNNLLRLKTVNSLLIEVEEAKVSKARILKGDEDGVDGSELSDVFEENAIQIARFTFDHHKKIVPNEFIRKDVRFLNDRRTKTKIEFVNAVSSSLISGPNLKKKDDQVRCHILECAENVADIDPEFVLKVAVYARRELNIRSTANLLVAFAASDERCRLYLQKYYNCAVRLPSDWTDTAEQCQLFLTEKQKSRSLPAALRRAMVAKFGEFDEYQLAKYNKVKKAKKAGKEMRLRSASKTYATAVRGQAKAKNDLKVVFSQKILIRLLHLSKPANFVMGILEKKYPRSLAEFWASGLSGMWDDERSGKKMKLATPETWETQLCLHRNVAATWQKLIDDKKLPFMAMLRNLRNLVVAKIPEEYRKKVISILTNRESVIRSKQFPFRFLTAYNVMLDVEVKCTATKKKAMSKTGKPRDMEKWLWRLRKLSYQKIAEITGKYKKALSKSIDIATLNNVAPIRGHAIILCDCNSDMSSNCLTTKSLQRATSNRDIALLMALMCKHVCESSDLHLFGNKGDALVQLVKNKSILENLDAITSKLKEDEKLNEMYRVDPNNEKKVVNNMWVCGVNKFPEGIFNKIYEERTQVDTLIVFSNEDWKQEEAVKFVKKYRVALNEKLLYVFVDFNSYKSKTEFGSTIGHPNNIYLSGFSDQLLRYVAERGSSQQLRDINQIDVKYKLKGNQALRKANKDLLSTPFISVPKWRTARVFVSSTFRDMHGERDLLLRSVFPQLRARALDLCVDVHDIDLRWGITEQEAEDNKMVEICLTEAAECDLFVGLLGSRYGSIVTPEQIPESERFDRVREYPAGSSITELEFEVGLLGRSNFAAQRAVVCIRDNAFIDRVPDEYLNEFLAESHADRMRLEKLKSRVRSAHFPLIDNYACEWNGDVNGVAAVSGLDDLGTAIVNCLWSGLEALYSGDDVESGNSVHENFAAQRSASFSGRNGVLTQCLTAVKSCTELIVVNGKSGSGKTSFMSKLCVELMQNAQNVVIPYFADAVSGEESTDQIIEYFCNKLALSMKSGMQDGDCNTKEIHEMLDTAVEYTARFVLLVDGVEEVAWIPNPVPPNVQFVCTLTDSSVLMRRMSGREFLRVPLSPLILKERAQLVRANLLPHRKKLSESFLDNQLNELIMKREAYSPLFLTFACHQMRLFLVFENMSENLKKMPNTVSGLWREILVQLERFNGSVLVLTAFKLLLMSKDGLSEEELYGMLNLWMCSRKSSEPDLVEMCRLGKRKLLSPSHFAQFYQSVKVFFNLPSNSRDNALKMSHQELVSVVSNYCKSLANDLMLNKCMAVYYLQQIDPMEDENWVGRNPKAFERVISRLVSSGNLEKAATMMTDLKFLFAKSNVGLCQSILEDFALIQREIGADARLDRWKFKVDAYQRFCNRHRRALSEAPSRIFQLATNERQDSIVSSDAARLENLPRMIEWLNKLDQEDHCTAVFTLPQDVNCVSSFGCIAAAGLVDGSIQLIDLTTSKIVRKIKTHCAGITCIGFVDANLLMCASESFLNSWDVNSGNGVTTFEGHGRRVAAFVVIDRSTMVSVSWDRSIKTWDVKTGRNLSTRYEKSPINCCVKHPVRNDVAIGLWDGSVRIWNLITLKRIAILHGHKTSVTSISLSACGKYLASSSLDGRIVIWSSRHGFKLANFRASNMRINEIAFNGKNLWSVGDDCAVKVWSSLLSDTHQVSCSLPSTSKVLHIASNPFNIHGVVVAYEDSTIVSFDGQTGDVFFSVRPSTSRVCCVYFSECVYVAYLNDDLQVLDSETGAIVESFSERAHAVSAVCRTGNGALIFGCADGTYSEGKHDDETRFKAHDNVITCVAAHPDNYQMFATVSRDKSLKVWRSKNRLVARVDDCHADWINHCVWTVQNASELLITASNDNSVKLWSFRQDSLTLLLVLGHTTGPAIFVDVWENCVVCGASDGNMKMFTLKGSEVLSVEGEATTQFVSCFQTNTRQITDWYDEVVDFEKEEDEETTERDKSWPSGSLMSISNGLLKKTKLFGCNKVAILSGHAGFVQTVSVLADETVVTGSVDQTLMTWNVNGRTDSGCEENRSEICSIAWDQDERLMISCCRDGSVSFWRNENVGDKMIQFSSLKLNSECVSGIHLIRKDKFIAVCDDGFVILCEFGENFSKLSDTRKLERTISCSAYCDINDALALASMDGRVCINSVKTGKMMEELDQLELDWVVDMKFKVEQLYMLTASGRLFFFHAHTNENSYDTPKAEVELDEGVIPLCFSLGCNFGFIGLSDGVVVRTEAVEDECDDRIHVGGVKFCIIDESKRVLITASNDRTVKVFNMFKYGDTSQAAQFECSAPVCALSLSPINNLIVCGDFHGKIYFLRLLQAT